MKILDHLYEKKANFVELKKRRLKVGIFELIKKTIRVIRQKEYSCMIIMGMPGAGKNIRVSSIIKKRLRKKKGNIYINTPHKQATYFDVSECDNENFRFMFKPESLIIFDEASFKFDSRKSHSFNDHFKTFMMLHRHHKQDMIFITQDKDQIDLQIRRVTKNIQIQRKVLLWSLGYKVKAKFGVVKGKESEEAIDIVYKISFWPKSICFIPKYIDNFDSYDVVVHSDGKEEKIESTSITEKHKIKNDKSFKNVRSGSVET